MADGGATIEEARIERVVDCANFLGESPLWCDRSQSLYWVNCEHEPTLFNRVIASGVQRSWPMPSRIGAVALRADGGLIVALADGVYRFDPDDAGLALIAPAPDVDTVVLHEGKCDRQGRFWIGSLSRRLASHGERGGASFYRLDGDRLVPQIGGLSVSNGLAWSPDGRVMYQTDTLAGTVWAWDYDVEDGSIANRRDFFSVPFAQGQIDGAAVDAEGGYWSALFRGSCLRRYRPDGTLDRELRLPIAQPTMAAFGGPGLDELYLTSTRYGPRPGEPNPQPGLGDLYRIAGAGTGLAEARWVG